MTSNPSSVSLCRLGRFALEFLLWLGTYLKNITKFCAVSLSEKLGALYFYAE